MYRDHPSISNHGITGDGGGESQDDEEEADGLHIISSSSVSADAISHPSRRQIQWGKRCIVFLLVAPFLVLIAYCSVYILEDNHSSSTSLADSSSTTATMSTSDSRTGEALPEDDKYLETPNEAISSSNKNNKDDGSNSSGSSTTTHSQDTHDHARTPGCLPDRFDNEGMDLMVDPVL